MYLKTALTLTNMGIHVFPTSPNSKVPLKGTHGEKDSTTDKETVTRWFKNTNNNIAIDLKKSHLMAVDVDINHNEHSNGKHSLVKVFDQFGRFPDTLVEQTPRGGLHYFFKIPQDINLNSKSNNVFFADSGIELLTNKVHIFPSVVDGEGYKQIEGSFQSIAMIPKWLREYMQQDNSDLSSIQIYYGVKKYTGALLDEFVKGSTKGERNDFLMRCTAKMLAVGADLQTIITMLKLINRNFVDVPLEQKEVENIFKSMVKKNNSRGV